MGEAVAKEPSMEEILSSIRKIITDDGGSDTAAKTEVTSDKKPDIQIAKTAKANKPAIAPSAAEIKNALAAIQENVKETAAKTKEVEAAVETTPAKIKVPETKAPEAKVEVISSLASAEADSISFVDMSSSKTEAPAQAANDEAEAEAAPKIETAETVSEVPAQKSKSSTQDNEAMGSNEAAKFKGALMSSNTDQIVNEAFEELRRVTMDDIDEKTESMLRPMLSEWLDNNLPTLVERLVREEIERVSGSR